MPPYYDIYVLAPERSTAVAERFINTFAPEREQSDLDYAFPRYAEHPEVVINSAAEGINYCEAHSDAGQCFYFRNLGSGPVHAMLFFTEDGGLILGISVVGDADEWFVRLVESAESNIGYVTFESLPVSTVYEFRQVANGP